jgi:choline kinase
VYGTLENGRVEEYFESHTLTPTDIRYTQISRWIAVRMAELHSVDVKIVEGAFSHRDGSIRDKAWDIGVTRNVNSWISLARKVVALEGFPASSSGRHVDLDLFAKEWEQYLRWLASIEKVQSPSPRVFAHNDAQCGNLLRLTKVKQGAPEPHQVCLSQESLHLFDLR